MQRRKFKEANEGFNRGKWSHEGKEKINIFKKQLLFPAFLADISQLEQEMLWGCNQVSRRFINWVITTASPHLIATRYTQSTFSLVTMIS